MTIWTKNLFKAKILTPKNFSRAIKQTQKFCFLSKSTLKMAHPVSQSMGATLPPSPPRRLTIPPSPTFPYVYLWNWNTIYWSLLRYFSHQEFFVSCKHNSISPFSSYINVLCRDPVTCIKSSIWHFETTGSARYIFIPQIFKIRHFFRGCFLSLSLYICIHVVFLFYTYRYTSKWIMAFSSIINQPMVEKQ